MVHDRCHSCLFDGSTTVEEMYNKSKCKILRLYLATKQIGVSETSSDSEEGSSAIPLPKLGDPSPTSRQSSTESLPDVIRRKSRRLRSRSEKSGMNTGLQNNNSSPDTDELTKVYLNTGTKEDEIPILFESSDTEIEFGPIDGSPIFQTLEETVVFDPLSTETITSLLQGPELLDEPQPTHSSLPSPSPHSPRSPTPPVEDSTVITLHRSNIQQDMIAVFMDPAIVDVSIKVRFVDELGADNQGLSREAYSAFWKEFFLTCTCGEDERVPALFLDYGKDEWEAVGKILLKGYLDTGVYPLQLSFTFSVALINGESAVSSDILIKSLRI